jgi:DNA-binding beta-propeller fold protein YncE
MQKATIGRNAIRGLFVLTAIGFFCWSVVERLEYGTGPRPIARQATGYPQLISYGQLPDTGDICLPESAPAYTEASAGPDDNLFSSFEATTAHASAQQAGTTVDITRPPVRTVWDTDPIYSSIAVDAEHDEVVLVDTNTFAVKTFDRLENTPSNVRASVPKRVIEGPKTKLEFNNGLYIDPKTGDVTTVAADNDHLVTFPHGATGDVEPTRDLRVTHRGYAIAVDEAKQQMYLTIQYPPEISVYRKNANGNDKPIRRIAGESTRLSDVHGMAIDTKNRLIFVNNWGHVSDPLLAGTGRFEAPSISVYPLDADGDTPPLRVIQGSKTQLNWPAMMSLDPQTGDLFVANDLGHEILVFHTTDKGDIAPRRSLKGDKTGLSNPMGIFVDSKNKELWVANLGNSSATVYPLNASGNQPPLRTIRTAPSGKISLKFGKPSGTAYDSKREQLLVAN